MYKSTTSAIDQKGDREVRFDSPEQEAYLNIWRTYDRLRALEDDLFGQENLTAQQYNALRLLRHAGVEGLPTLSLAGKLVSRAPDITRLLDRLVDRGLVWRARSDRDRRAVMVGITDTGRSLLARLQTSVRACHLKQLGHLSSADLDAIVSLMRRARGPHDDAGW